MKILTTYIDIQGSTSIEDMDAKTSIIEVFYQWINKINGDFGKLNVKDIVYLGDGAIIFCKTKKLDKHDLLNFITSVEENTNEFEDDKKQVVKIGMAYGVYGDVQTGDENRQQAIYISPAFDYSSKGSSIARTTSITQKYVVISKNAKNNKNMNNSSLIEILKELDNDEAIELVTSSGSGNARFDIPE